MAKKKEVHNQDNLIPVTKRTKEQQREICRMGGKASGEARRKRKAMREVLTELLDLPMKEEQAPQVLKSFADFAKDKNVTVEQAVLMAQIIKAVKGDTKAATFVRDTAGQKILRDAAESNTEFEDDGFVAAIKAASKGVWDDDDKQA